MHFVLFLGSAELFKSAAYVFKINAFKETLTLTYFLFVGRLEGTHANGDQSRLHIVGDKWTLAFTPYLFVISGGGDGLFWRLLTQKNFERRRSALPGV